MPVPSRFLAAALLAAAMPAMAGPLADISVRDQRAGHELTIHWHEGRRYVVGEPGREYEIRVRNHTSQRVLAVTSVDGVNVLSGETAAPNQIGYVIQAQGQTRIDGWRKNLSEVAAFYFTRLPDAYAARTGRPDQVGVIGVALYREKTRCCRWWRDEADRLPALPAPAEEADARAGPSVDHAEPRARESERLGTGHGQRLESPAYQTPFERASEQPDEIIAILYNSRANLIAQGVIPAPRRYARRPPEPFPAAGAFVPDP